MIYADVLASPDSYSFAIASLGSCTVPSPLAGRAFVDDDEEISFASQVKNIRSLLAGGRAFPAFQKAGPRRLLFHDPATTHAGIVTCGGLCPGLNNVIKGLVTVLRHGYGVREVSGFRYGYQGLVPRFGHPPLQLTEQAVDGIHRHGGTILGSSRGNQDCGEMVDSLVQQSVSLLFCIGGDGTLRGADAIAAEVGRRRLSIGVIGIPKTIDNDIRFVERTFGFETAVHAASEIITSAHNEAEGADNGVAIVKLMGRDSGFVAAAATLANSAVDFCLVPEVEFSLEGERGLFDAIERRLACARHAVVVAAEGAGQSLFTGADTKRDASGNVLNHDVGVLLKDEIGRHFRAKGRAVSLKYLDPSYHIRSVAAIAGDSSFCSLLAEHAVHAGMAGKTGLLVGHWNNYFTHVPIALATRERKKLEIDGALWNGVLSATKQNEHLGPH
jgi:6-phosphofructokinase 1